MPLSCVLVFPVSATLLLALQSFDHTCDAWPGTSGSPISAYSHHLLGRLKVTLAHLHSIISIILEILAQVLLNSGFSGAWTGCVQMDIAQALSTTVDTIKALL